MPHYLTELYSPKPAWLALSLAERQSYFASIAEGMGALSALGVEPIAFGETEPSIHPAPQQFFSVWRLPDAEAQAALLSGIAATGWHDYFDTVNAAGKGVDFPAHLTQLTGV
ncbi:hypothetical protein KM031_13670 [Gemmobacter fulvus]|uniref:Uncharacterized protein n=1 Tax=Gemmobacter fulvus TaxID=2840474 RepID=A0A975S126_9RHOB|nr:DUF6616 family protein [Gemmobacter fulvus]MBT9247106.1 hypothetical protein [Gemmobacter fulvus]MDQ1847528.1 hypothetical protein [Gemmobacter fulvus]QWK89871.1 hypothetical protein KM031_13670 [Gemmobacter fulvus]